MENWIWIVFVFAFGWIDHQLRKRNKGSIRRSKGLFDYLFKGY